jgi:hypothetical protein
MTLSIVSPRLVDPRDNRLGTASHEAADRVETALWRLMSFFDTPIADLEAAQAADPGWGLPLVMQAGFLLSLTEPGHLAQARQLLDAAEPLLEDAPPRERAHFEAQRAVAEGRWQHACRIWDELLLEHPRDALALQWAQLWDFYRGDSLGLRLRPARALPEWSESDPLFPCVLGLYAFGLEECNLYPQAEDVGRRAVSGDARDPGPCMRWPTSWRCRAASKTAPRGCASTSRDGPKAMASRAICGGTWACSGSKRSTCPACSA